jgi:two-component system, OmpR family, phosphate regulon response regulator PhoB
VLRILIAGDDRVLASLASEILIDASFACGWVPSAEDCLKGMRFKRPHLLLIENTLPGMWGITPLRKLRGSRHFYDLPVIIFTAMQGEEDEAQAIYGGAQDFGRKPFEPLAGAQDNPSARTADRAPTPYRCQARSRDGLRSAARCSGF